ncbi:2,3-diaminopropionate biosynthesis protein SbnB [Micromonospora sp. NPDC051300]|uniref:2,3-diaminopropionate biosynthesis protein SbnB n=1 Tax=Micromonospora sp. NPDC051300 TaxID=3364286 RepID=UPI003798CD1B
MNQPPRFAVVSGVQVRGVLQGREDVVTRIVESAYRLHGTAQTINPDSYFLRFPQRPADRIIALPASAGGHVNVHGIKWISSFPDNTEHGLPRASAVTILNDPETGYPFACIEGSIISAARTAASAALAAMQLSTRRGSVPRRVGFVGAGLIARYIHTYLERNGFVFDEVGVHDTLPDNAERFRRYLERTRSAPGRVYADVDSLLRASDLVVFATVTGSPHVTDPALFQHNPLVLHVSLRDLAPEIILSAFNVVDDIDHCLKAGTSPHLAEQRAGNRDFIAGTLYDVVTDNLEIPADRPVIFSPFGLGVLDLAVARYVYDELAGEGVLHEIVDFFDELKRYG